MLLYDLTDEHSKAKLKYALVGGYALALHGIVRATMDVDLVINLNLKSFELAEKLFAKLGLQSRLPIRAQDVIKMRKEYIENRNLIAWSFVDYQNPTRQVGILINENLAALKTKSIAVGGRKITVATLEEILRMKMAAGRPQDLLDIENIKRVLDGKKSKINSQQFLVPPEEAIKFLEDFRNMVADQDEPTQAINIRVPANILRAVKTKAKSDGKKYQSLIIEYIRKGLKS